MFKRRQSLSFLSSMRRILWPERGFRRLFSYLIQRVARMPGSPVSISIGVACGVAVSFTPFIGFHLFLGAFLAYVFRGHVLASAIGSMVGNPWTFPLIYAATFKVGKWGLAHMGHQTPSLDLSIRDILANPSELLSLFLPLGVGGVILGTIAWFSTFGLCYLTLTGWREHRAKKLAAGRKRRHVSKTVEKDTDGAETKHAPSPTSVQDDKGTETVTRSEHQRDRKQDEQ
jgi:uncharacterized protein (DUF2062 family)